MNQNTEGSESYVHDRDPVAPGREESMKSNVNTTLGDLVAAVFDEAAYYSADLRRVSHLATQAVARLLRRARSRAAGTDATQGAIWDGCRFPAYATCAPVGAQIRVAVYAAASSRSPAQVDPSRRSVSFGRSHDIRRT